MGKTMVWYYIAVALTLSAVICLVSIVALDYSTYLDLQRRLRKERNKAEPKPTRRSEKHTDSERSAIKTSSH